MIFPYLIPLINSFINTNVFGHSDKHEMWCEARSFNIYDNERFYWKQ
jgi:hypothetical protein